MTRSKTDSPFLFTSSNFFLAGMSSLLAMAILSLCYWLNYSRPVALIYLTAEDRWTEYGTFVCWICAALLVSAAMVNDANLRRPGMFLFAIGAFFFGMEEISWGERLFGFDPPEIFYSINSQQELTLHNMVPLDSYYSYIGPAVLLFAVGIPLLAVGSNRIRHLFDRFGMPLVPWTIWPLFFLVVYIKHIHKWILPLAMNWESTEVMLSIAMLVLAVHVFLISRGKSVPPASRMVATTVGMFVIATIATAPLVGYCGSKHALADAMYRNAAIEMPLLNMNKQAAEIFAYMRINNIQYYNKGQLEHGLILVQLDRDDEAQSVLHDLIDITANPLSPAGEEKVNNILRTRGRAFLLLGRMDEAMEAFAAALKADELYLESLSNETARPWRTASILLTLRAMKDDDAAEKQLDILEQLNLTTHDNFSIQLQMRDENEIQSRIDHAMEQILSGRAMPIDYNQL